MKIKLIQQDRVIDTATRVGNLNFSNLRSSAPWEIYIGDGSALERAAKIEWPAADAYELSIYCNGGVFPAQYINKHEEIIPAVKHWLDRLFQLDGEIVALNIRAAKDIIVLPRVS